MSKGKTYDCWALIEKSTSCDIEATDEKEAIKIFKERLISWGWTESEIEKADVVRACETI